ncbi:Flp pilus assembly complex ATPase component TadA [candidate division KSB1 bacterium]|nr:Flp pilus assembly complex ATPase component TadA [candidate division KSB1 bacterium]
MVQLVIKSPDGTTQVQNLNEGSLIIGRRAPAQLILSKPNVSSQHAEIVVHNDTVTIRDLQSVNGTFVNNEKIAEKVLADGDEIRISDFHLSFTTNGSAEHRRSADDVAAPEIRPKVVISKTDEYLALKRRLHDMFIERMDLKRLNLGQVGDKELRKKTIKKIDELLEEIQSDIPASIDANQLRKEMIDDVLGLGPLEELLEDDTVTEIMVNRPDQIYIEKNGKLILSGTRFMSDQQVLNVIQRIVAPLGRSINESTPLVDARLADGSRVNAIIPPLAIQGSTLTIRKFSKRRLVPEDLLKFGTLTEKMLEFLSLCVRQRKNIVISGGTGSGKTTLLNILSSFIPDDERIVTVEDAAELNLPQAHVVRLEARPPNIEGKGAITIRDLVKNCLRMRPDRIVVGECRSGEALDMLQAMNTGHDGSLTTGHANSPRDILSRLETMVLMSGMDLPVRAIRDQISAAVDVIVQQSRLTDGSRKITHITEVTGMEGDIITLQDIFLFNQTGYTENGKIKGYFSATGAVPAFVDDLRRRGIPVNMELFDPTEKK